MAELAMKVKYPMNLWETFHSFVTNPFFCEKKYLGMKKLIPFVLLCLALLSLGLGSCSD